MKYRNNRFGGLLSLLATIVLLAVVTAPVLADVAAINIGCTNTIANSATTTANLGSAVKVDRTAGPLTVETRVSAGGTGTNTWTWKWARSLDGTIWETPTNTYSFTNLNNATVTNFQVLSADYIGSCHSIKLISVTHATASGVAADGTNVSVRVGIKRN